MSQKDDREGNTPDPKAGYRNGRTGKDSVIKRNYQGSTQFRNSWTSYKSARNDIHNTGSPQRK